VEYFKYLGAMINDATYTREIKARIVMVQKVIRLDEDSFRQQNGLQFKEETL
jgi:hypothetical protein